jgi:fused signal recognition particle receptor
VFNFIKNQLKKIYTSISSKLSGLFSSHQVDTQTLKFLERILLEADTGVATTRSLITKLESDVKSGLITQGADLKQALFTELLNIATQKEYTPNAPIVLFVGINGSGKTTTAAKMAAQLKNNGKKVLLVAGDTFRAAATEQLREWANKIGVDIVIGAENQDPASVIFSACEKYQTEKYDILIIDTAGRLQTKTNLMKELEKIGKTINRQLPNTKISTLLTVDAMLGQNSFDQAQLFNESTRLDGIVLTKLDGTGKGGIVFSIMQKLQVPVAYITFGEQLENIKTFNAQQYVTELLNS